MSRGTIPKDSAALPEAEALVEMLQAADLGKWRKTPQGAANVLMMALAVLVEDGFEIPPGFDLGQVLDEMRAHVRAERAAR
jgi:hypothetical protein